MEFGFHLERPQRIFQRDNNRQALAGFKYLDDKQKIGHR
jgi:hypothetical protein